MGPRLEGWATGTLCNPCFETLAQPLSPPKAAKRQLAPQHEVIGDRQESHDG